MRVERSCSRSNVSLNWSPKARTSSGGPSSTLTAATAKPRGASSRYTCSMAGISTRHGTHQVAQMLTSVTLPRYRSRSETESPLLRSTARNSGAVAPTSTGATSLPTRVMMVAPAATPATTSPTKIHCFDMRSSHSHGTAAPEIPHRGGRVGRAEHGGAGDEGVGAGAPRLADGIEVDAAVHRERGP